MKTTVLLLCLTLAACAPDRDPSDVAPDRDPSDVASPARGYHVTGNAMRDPYGDVLFLRGVNLSGRAKGAAGHLIPVDDELIAELRRDGVDSVRFLTFWDAVTPTSPQAVDHDYLSGLRERVERLSDAGIYVIIDVHQDLWGHPFSAHGAPGWACPDDLKEGFEYHSPWWSNYLTGQISSCFDHFWDSETLQAHYAAMLAEVAAVTCDVPRVVGFDIMNEPWPGSRLPDPAFDNDILLPFYIEVLEVVEKICPGKIFFFEPSGAFTFGLADAMQIPGDLLDRVVVAPHFYPPYVHEPERGGYRGTPEARGELYADLYDDWGAYLDMGVALWCGEYGGMTQSPNFDLYMQDLFDFFLEHFVSSAYWDHAYGDGGFDFLDAAGDLKDVFVPVFRTPWPTLIPDVPTSLTADWTARTLSLQAPCRQNGALHWWLPEGCDCEIPTCDADETISVTCACP